MIAHGTVIALFVAQQTGGDAFELWKRLECADWFDLDLGGPTGTVTTL